MLKEKQLNDDLMQFKTNAPLTISEAKSRIEKITSENNIPALVEVDSIKVGGLFNSQVLDCLVIKHPEHMRDYYHIVVVIGTGIVMVASTGNSKQMKKFATAEALKADRKGKSLSYKIGNAAVGSLFLLGKSKNKLEMEQNYYDTILEATGVCLEFE